MCWCASNKLIGAEASIADSASSQHLVIWSEDDKLKLAFILVDSTWFGSP